MLQGWREPSRALISGHFEVRLPGQRPAMAATDASRLLRTG